ncbi:MAG: hypothetical protein ACOYB4_00810 [Methyloceanibacter sp.]
MTKATPPSWENVSFDYCRLVDFYLRLDPDLVVEEAERSYGYKIIISEKQAIDATIVAVANFVVQSQLEQKTEAEVGAKYLFAFSTKHEARDSDSQVKDVARLSVWPVFAFLFKQIVSQAELPFPPLPLTPDHVDMEGAT